jgi:Bacterial regulatory proteins, gntR family
VLREFLITPRRAADLRGGRILMASARKRQTWAICAPSASAAVGQAAPSPTGSDSVMTRRGGAWLGAGYVFDEFADLCQSRHCLWQERPGLPLAAPAERAELAQHYGVAKMTVRRALEVLRERGIVQTLHGRGSVVVKVP